MGDCTVQTKKKTFLRFTKSRRDEFVRMNYLQRLECGWLRILTIFTCTWIFFVKFYFLYTYI